MFEKLKQALVELLSPAIRRAIVDELEGTGKRLEELEARIARIEQRPKTREWVPIAVSLASLLVACTGAYFTYRIQWSPFFTEMHTLNGSITDVTVAETRLEAQIIFSNECTQTEVVYGGKFLYA